MCPHQKNSRKWTDLMNDLILYSVEFKEKRLGQIKFTLKRLKHQVLSASRSGPSDDSLLLINMFVRFPQDVWQLPHFSRHHATHSVRRVRGGADGHHRKRVQLTGQLSTLQQSRTRWFQHEKLGSSSNRTPDCWSWWSCVSAASEAEQNPERICLFCRSVNWQRPSLVCYLEHQGDASSFYSPLSVFVTRCFQLSFNN